MRHRCEKGAVAGGAWDGPVSLGRRCCRRRGSCYWTSRAGASPGTTSSSWSPAAAHPPVRHGPPTSESGGGGGGWFVHQRLRPHRRRCGRIRRFAVDDCCCLLSAFGPSADRTGGCGVTASDVYGHRARGVRRRQCDGRPGGTVPPALPTPAILLQITDECPRTERCRDRPHNPAGAKYRPRDQNPFFRVPSLFALLAYARLTAYAPPRGPHAFGTFPSSQEAKGKAKGQGKGERQRHFGG